MASSKDTFEGHSFRASTFACGAFRGTGPAEVQVEATATSSGGIGGVLQVKGMKATKPAPHKTPQTWPEKPKWRPLTPTADKTSLLEHNRPVFSEAGIEGRTRFTATPTQTFRRRGRVQCEAAAGGRAVRIHALTATVVQNATAGGEVVTVDGLQLRLRIMLEDHFLLGGHVNPSLAGGDELLGTLAQMLEDQSLLG